MIEAEIASTEAALAARAQAKDTQNAWDANRRAADRAATAYGKLGRAGVTALGDVESAANDLFTEINNETALLNLQGKFDDVKAAGEEAWIAAAEGAEDAEAKGRAYELKLNDLQIAVGEYGSEILELPDEQLTELIMNTPNLQQTEDDINQLARDRILRITLRYIGQRFDPNFEDRPGDFGRSAPTSTSTQNITVNFPKTASMRELDASMANWKRANG